jgi:DNA modification methylase
MTVRILTGDVRAVLATLPDESVDCCVTSPPYWGLRSYLPPDHPQKHLEIGSEPTVHEWVMTMVEVFGEVRRVLKPEGTLWLNLGDSYAGARPTQGVTPPSSSSTLRGNGHIGGGPKAQRMTAMRCRDNHAVPRSDVRQDGLKPKDMVGQPWRVAFALQDAGWWLRQEIIWAKRSPMPESVRDRFTKSHEHVFLLAKSPTYYFDAESIQEPSTERSPGNKSHKYTAAYEADSADEKHRTKAGLLEFSRKQQQNGANSTRNPRSVRWLASEPFRGAHFATYPPELIRPFVLAGCPPGGTVLDPFGGSGTTGLVADQEGRNAILIDLDERNGPMAENRITGPAPLLAEVLLGPDLPCEKP